MEPDLGRFTIRELITMLAAVEESIRKTTTMIKGQSNVMDGTLRSMAERECRIIAELRRRETGLAIEGWKLGPTG